MKTGLPLSNYFSAAPDSYSRKVVKSFKIN